MAQISTFIPSELKIISFSQLYGVFKITISASKGSYPQNRPFLKISILEALEGSRVFLSAKIVFCGHFQPIYVFLDHFEKVKLLTIFWPGQSQATGRPSLSSKISKKSKSQENSQNHIYGLKIAPESDFCTQKFIRSV